MCWSYGRKQNGTFRGPECIANLHAVLWKFCVRPTQYSRLYCKPMLELYHLGLTRAPQLLRWPRNAWKIWAGALASFSCVGRVRTPSMDSPRSTSGLSSIESSIVSLTVFETGMQWFQLVELASPGTSPSYRRSGPPTDSVNNAAPVFMPNFISISSAA